MRPENIRDLCDSYKTAPRTTPLAHRAYRVLSAYVLDRAQEAIRAGWTFTRDTTGDAPDIAEAYRTRVMPVYDGAHGHPEFSDVENFLFRFVHDTHGHSAAIGFGFESEVLACQRQQADLRHWGRAHGIPTEEIRYASRALYAEIVGQAACFEIDGCFPAQKALLL